MNKGNVPHGVPANHSCSNGGEEGRTGGGGRGGGLLHGSRTEKNSKSRITQNENFVFKLFTVTQNFQVTDYEE